MKARFESAYRSQIQWQEVEEQRAVRLGGQRHHFPLLVLPGVVVDPLQVGGLSAQTWTVVHQLAVNFARRKIDERHFVVNQNWPQTYSIRGAGRPVFPPRVSPPSNCTYSFRDSAPNSTLYFWPCLRSVTPLSFLPAKVAPRTSVDAGNRLC